MLNTSDKYKVYVNILKRELVPAMGCTEPIALAYCAAKARVVLGDIPDRVTVKASGNIIKNVKSVTVPHTNGKKGIEAAAAIGILAGNPDKELEVLADVKPFHIAALDGYLKTAVFRVEAVENCCPLDITVCVGKGNQTASVHIAEQHANIVKMEKNGAPVWEKRAENDGKNSEADYSLLTMNDVYDFALSVNIDDVKDVLERQIAYNCAVSTEGLVNNYGANIGKILLEAYGTDIRSRAKAKAAAGSDARMNGCELPVIINSGSGNQGITTSLPVIEYAKELNADREKLLRALVISNLTAIHLKSGIGSLSAYCGAVSAGAAAGAGIAFLQGGSYEIIEQTVTNALAITSGIICDGAKASCAAKIATAVDAGILGYEMSIRNKRFYAGEGIVSDSIEKTIRNVTLLGKDGMRETDKEILSIMTCFD